MNENFCPEFLASGVSAGLKDGGEKDLGLIWSKTPACAAAVFTKNLVKAAPVLIGMERIKSGLCQAVVVNSRNANCCTGEKGRGHVLETSAAVSERLGIDDNLVHVGSTGVIGEPLPVEKIVAAIPELAGGLSEFGWEDFARAIMTTDTVPKLMSVRENVAADSFTITGAAKGAGMIRPDMATMLCYVCTDVKASAERLQSILKGTVDRTFNRITIDGDTSTNDTVLVLANGASRLSLDHPDVCRAFEEKFEEVLTALAKMIVKDGEGATKLVKIEVKNAGTDDDAQKIADAVANSSLVKTAVFGEDANWGRVLAAAGRSGAWLDPDGTDIFFDDIPVVKNGCYLKDSDQSTGAEALKKDEFIILLDLKRGKGNAFAYTCDFSIDYVKINSNYRT